MENDESYSARSVEEPVWDKDNPPWNSITAVSYWLLSILAIIFCQALLGIAYSAWSGIALVDTIEHPDAILVQIIAVLPAHLFTLAVGWMIVTRMGRYSFSEMLGMKWGGFRWWHLVVILAGIMALFALLLWVFGDKENDLDRVLKSSRAAVYAIAIMATFSAPIIEEVVYRGVMYSALARSINVAGAVAITTGLFAAVHLPQYWGDYATISALLSLSLVLSMVRVLSGNLLPCIALHFLFNGIQTTLLVLEPWIEKAPEISPVQ